MYVFRLYVEGSVIIVKVLKIFERLKRNKIVEVLKIFDRLKKIRFG